MPISPFQYREMLMRSEGRNQNMAQSVVVERESDLHDQILEHCKNLGWIAVHSRMDKSTTTGLGVPDFIIATTDGRTLWVEAKRKNGKPTPHQQAMLHWLERNKQICGVVRSIEEFIALSKRSV